MDGRAFGIDVSHHNPAINWSNVAQAGISFAFAKVSQGADPAKDDQTFSDHWQGMKDAGIIRGAYHFIGLPSPTTPQSQWDDDIHKQIDHFLGIVGPPQPGDLPPALDFEDGDSPARWRALVTSDLPAALSVVREFITYAMAQLGPILPVIYTGNFWWGELGNPDPQQDNMPFSACPLWFAQYPIGLHTPAAVPGPPGSSDQGEARHFTEYAAHLDGHQPLHIPKVWGGPSAPTWKFWQFSEYGTMPDLAGGFLDLSVFNGSLADLQKFVIPST